MATVSEDKINVVKESMQRCTANPVFLDNFYAEFTKTPQVRDMFRTTDMGFQKVVLKASLHLMIMVAKGGGGESMNKLAISHDRHHLNITRDLYSVWLDAMLCAVKASDSGYTPEIGGAWLEVMQPGIEYMCSRY